MRFAWALVALVGSAACASVSQTRSPAAIEQAGTTESGGHAPGMSERASDRPVADPALDDQWRTGTSTLIGDRTELVATTFELPQTGLGRGFGLRLARRVTGKADSAGATFFAELARAPVVGDINAWGLGYEFVVGGGEPGAPGLAMGAGLHYQQHGDGTMADSGTRYRNLSSDFNLYVPVGDQLSFDVGIRPNILRLFGKGGTASRGPARWTPTFAGATAYVSQVAFVRALATYYLGIGAGIGGELGIRF